MIAHLAALRRFSAPAVVVWAALVCAVALVGTSVPVAAGGPTVSGAGSTWVQIALDQWRADIARQGYSINYQGVGSSAGREFYIINQVDFAASEIPFQPDEVAKLQAEHKSYQYTPDVAGGTSLMYNLHTPSGSRITSLRMDATTAGRIFTGALTSWQDGAIQALNPGLQIAETRIIPVIRSDGSGTSAQFSLYLADQASSVWNAFVSAQGCAAPCSQWPPFGGSTQQKGSDGVANFVANDAIGSGAIGYVEAGYAFGRGFPVASLHNASGNFTQPTSNNVATALLHATLYPDLTQNLTGVYRSPEANAYPMSSYSYLITPTTGFDPAKGAVLGTWMIYIACAGQREAAPLGYSPLPRNLVQDMFDAVTRIPGAPKPPPLDAQHCPNPTIVYGTGGSAGGAAAGPGASAPVSTHSTTRPVAGAPGAAPTAAAADAAAAGSPSAGATGADGTPATGADTSDPAALAASVATLNAAARRASFAAAVSVVGDARAVREGTLMLVAGVVLLLIFAPLLAAPVARRQAQSSTRGER